jgi:hypothetical protein
VLFFLYSSPQHSLSSLGSAEQTFTMHLNRLQHLLSWLPPLNLDIESPFSMFSSKKPTITSFTLFEKLPAELRKMVWKYVAIGQPRDIRFYHIKAAKTPYDHPGDVPVDYLEDGKTVPGILHGSYESRQEGLRFYKRVYLASSLDDCGYNCKWPCCGRYVYINWSTDILVDICHIARFVEERFDDSFESNRIQHIGLNFLDCACRLHTLIRSVMGEPGLYNVRKFTLIAWDYDASKMHCTLARELFREKLEAQMKYTILQALGMKKGSNELGKAEIEIKIDWRTSDKMENFRCVDNFQRYEGLSRGLSWRL